MVGNHDIYVENFLDQWIYSHTHTAAVGWVAYHGESHLARLRQTAHLRSLAELLNGRP